jgi:NADPH:quinone reductase-like Zn-dependent oxidoreductase
MKEVIVHSTTEVWSEIHDIPIPMPRPDEVVIKVIVAGSNPKGLFIVTPFIDNYINVL